MKVLFALSLLAAGVLLAADQAQPEAKKKLETLQTDLIVTLDHLAETMAERAAAGSVNRRDAMLARLEVLEAQLDAAENRIKQSAMHERIVEQQKRIDTFVQSSDLDETEKLRAKAARLKAEIAFEKFLAEVQPETPKSPVKFINR